MSNLPPNMTKEAFELFKREFEAGLMSNAMIGRTIGRSEGWVRQWGKKLNLKKCERIPTSILPDTMVTSEDGTVTVCESDISKGIDDHKANVTTAIIREHQGSLAQLRTLTDQLIQELAILSSYPTEIRKIAELVSLAQFPEDEDGKLVAERIKTYDKLLRMGNRVPALNSLVNSLTKLIETERKAFGLDKEASIDNLPDGLGVTPEKLLGHILQNKEALTLNLQINNNYGGESDVET
jgi:hypothetical protein